MTHALGAEPVNTPLTTCEAESAIAARIGGTLFRQRGWLPVLFLGVPLIARGAMSGRLWTIGLALVALGEAWRMWGVATAGGETRRRTRDVDRLVTHGPFALIRNPLYAGNFLIWMGFVVVSGVLWFLPVAIVLFAAEYSLIVRFEEGVLESTFGDEYLAYKRRTGRWIPRLSSRGVRGDVAWREAWRSETSTFLQYVVLTIALLLKSHFGTSQ